MPKFILETEDEEDFKYAMNGHRYSIIIDDLDNWLRSMSKYKDITTVSVEEVRAKIRELLSEFNLQQH